MTEEQYNRALEIYFRLEALKRVSEILSSSGLRFVREAMGFADREVILCLPEMKDILEHHKDLIREEIAQEMKDLVKEIETL